MESAQQSCSLVVAMDNENHFDVVILGTGLVESMIAAALAKVGCKVAHIDHNSYYGGDEACLSLDELAQWADNISSGRSSSTRFTSASRSPTLPPQTRQYSICLRPTVIPSIGPMISSLVASGVSKYNGFRLLESVATYGFDGRVRSVPGSKEDIFQDKEISLIEKRRLMRFLTFASGDFEDKPELEGKHDMPFIQYVQTVFSLTEQIASTIAYALAFCASSSEPTLPTLLRLRGYIRSSGRYGASPFLVGHYGGIGDIAQGFCRSAAVSETTYILGKRISSLRWSRDEDGSKGESDNAQPASNFTLNLDDFPDPLTCNLVISSPAYQFPNITSEMQKVFPVTDTSQRLSMDIARCIAFVDKPLSFTSRQVSTEAAGLEGDEPKYDGVDTAVLVFPPGSISNGSATHAATVFTSGEGSFSSPRDKWIAYISLPLPDPQATEMNPETILRPYLDALMTLSANPSESPIKPLFTIFYLERRLPSSTNTQTSETNPKFYLIPALLQTTPLPDLPDEAAKIAEETFHEAVRVLGTISPPTEGEDDGSVPFWPSLPGDPEEEEDWA